jgi:putative membrane protein
VTEELPSTWARLHPLSPLARAGAALVALGAVTLPRQFAEGSIDRTRIVLDVVVVSAIIGAGVVSWFVTRWQVSNGELQLETGLIRRQSIRVPLARVQAVDVVRPFAARLLGISELRLVLAGQGAGKAKLAYLSEGQALRVRAQLLALGAGLHADTPESPERPLASVPNSRLIGSALAGAPGVLLLVLVPVVVVLAVLAPEAIGPLLGSSLTLLLAIVAAEVRRVNVEFSFTVAESPDGLRLRSGLLQTRAETIPHGRVQAVRLVEPLLWRPFGWCRLEVDVAQQRERDVGQEDVQQLTRALLPVGTRADAEALLLRVFPQAPMIPPQGAKPPARARFKAPLSYHRLACWHDAYYLVARTGRLRAQTVLVPLVKAQSIRYTQGPVQRRLRLATVHVDTAGRRWKANARDRDVAEAAALVVELPALARTIRQG